MALVLPGQEVCFSEPGSRFARHHHLNGYAAVLVEGECEEAGDQGRFRVYPGQVLAHGPFDGHADRIGTKGALFINIPLCTALPSAFGSVSDLDGLIRAFERDAAYAEWLLHQQFVPLDHAADWPDLLAKDLSTGSFSSLGNWAADHGLWPGSVSRGFRLAYGVSPKRYRLEQMARRAALQILRCDASLAEVALQAGFADQPHMTRTLATLFGLPPRKLQRLS